MADCTVLAGRQILTLFGVVYAQPTSKDTMDDCEYRIGNGRLSVLPDIIRSSRLSNGTIEVRPEKWEAGPLSGHHTIVI
jgi:hypothetical protein